jgi:hypothetical protein
MTTLRGKFKQQGWAQEAPLTGWIVITDFNTEEPAPAPEPTWMNFNNDDDDLLVEKEDIAA